jgi:hypothetical protein
MGTYIYGIRSPKHLAKVELDNGQIMEVAKFAFAYKPRWGGITEPRWQILARARLTRMDNIWREFVANGGKWPTAGVLVGDDNKIEIGATVMTWPMFRILPTSIEDATCNNAIFIGKIVRVLS